MEVKNQNKNFNNKLSVQQHSLTKNAVLNTLRSVLSIIFPLITFPYISRVLQVESVGNYNFSSSVVSYFELIAGLGVSTYAIREGAQYRDDSKKIDRFVSEVFSINVYSTVFSYLLLFLSIIIIKKLNNYKLSIEILSLEIIFSTLGVGWVCNIFEDFLFTTLQSFFVQLISLLLTLLLVKKSSDLYIYMAIVVFARSGSSIVNYIYVKKKYCNFKFEFNCNFKSHIRPILIIFSSSVAITIYVNSDITMLGFMKNDYQVGLYSTSVKIYNIAKSILASVVSVFIPRFSYLVSSGDSKRINELFSKIFNTLVVMVIPSTVGLFLTSRDVIFLIGGINYLPGTKSLQLLSIAIAFSLYAYLFTQCILIPYKRENVVLKATVISAVVNIVLNFIFIPIFGINGAAITTIIAEMIVCFYGAFSSKKYIKLTGVKSNLISVGIGNVGIVFIVLLINKTIKICLLRFVMSIISATIVYVVILIIFHNKIMLNTIKKEKK